MTSLKTSFLLEVERLCSTIPTFTTCNMEEVSVWNIRKNRKSQRCSAPFQWMTNSYPNKWHEFLTGVLVGAVNKESEKSVRTTRGGFEHFNSPEVHANTQWSWREDGCGDGPAPCPAAEHGEGHMTGSGGMGVFSGSRYNEMDERIAPYNLN